MLKKVKTEISVGWIVGLYYKNWLKMKTEHAHKQLEKLLHNFLLKDSMQESFLAVSSTFWETDNLKLEKQIQSIEKMCQISR